MNCMSQTYTNECTIDYASLCILYLMCGYYVVTIYYVVTCCPFVVAYVLLVRM